MRSVSNLIKYKDYIIYSSRIQLYSRYSNKYLGYLWWFVDPLLFMAVYVFIYEIIFDRTLNHYIVFLLIGLIVWRWMSGSINSSTGAISGKIGLIENIAAPKNIFPLISILVELLFFVFAFILVFIAMGLDHVPLTWHIIEIFPITFITFIFLYGIGLVLCNYDVFIPDLKLIINYTLRILFFLSAIFYEPGLIPEQLQGLYAVNPFYIIVSSYRNVLMYDTYADYEGLGFILLAGLGLILIGNRLLMVHEKDYAKRK
jgi:ABC-type polysaccharide/polyol phosphate export permease